MNTCSCDGEVADFYRARRPMAHKHHMCDECGATIPTGERYEYATMLYDGAWTSYKTCVACLEMRDLVESASRCFCWHHCALHHDIRQWCEDEGPDYPGIRFALGRLVIAKRRERAK